MGYDRISVLPDSLITQILLYLPTKDSVKTSVLSTRWRNLWLNVPGLELHSDDFPSPYRDFIKNFTDRFLELNRASRLEKFKIKYDECNVYLFGISEWITAAINRGAQHLDVGTLRCPFLKDVMPLDIYKSKTLVSLKLVNVGMLSPEFVVSLPCLKIMHLEDILNSDDDPLIMEKLISGCPVLEDLTVCRVFDDNVPVLRVRSQTLKRFCVGSGPWRGMGDKEYAVEIDAPGLKYMNFEGDQSERIVVNNQSFLFMIDIDFQLRSTLVMKNFHEFLTSISSVRHVIISPRILKELYRCLNLGPIAEFQNLSRLEVSFCNHLLQVLPDFLEIFPYLKHLTLDLVYSTTLEPEKLELTNVPRCLLSTLECVEIKEVITGEKTAVEVAKHKKKIWMEVVRYFLENSVVLKKLILGLTDSDITKELFITFTNRSPSRRCQIIFR